MLCYEKRVPRRQPHCRSGYSYPALCGSHPLVTPYYCIGDLLWFVFMSAYCMFDLSAYCMFLQYFDTVGWVFWSVKTVSHSLYCVGDDVKHCSIQCNPDPDKQTNSKSSTVFQSWAEKGQENVSDMSVQRCWFRINERKSAGECHVSVKLLVVHVAPPQTPFDHIWAMVWSGARGNIVITAH